MASPPSFISIAGDSFLIAIRPQAWTWTDANGNRAEIAETAAAAMRGREASEATQR
jgi:hypothetical protein